MQGITLKKTQKFMKSLEKLATEQAEYPQIQMIANKMTQELQEAQKLKFSKSETAKRLKPLIENLDEEVYNIKNATPNDEITITCPVTNEELYILKDGVMKYLSEHGLCKKCGTDYHVKHLRSKGMERCQWPIRYMGFTCKTCWPEKN